jgi:GxxExxY protein
MELIAEQLAEQIIRAAEKIHGSLGPGLLESAYREALSHEMGLRQIPFEKQKPLPLFYKGARLDAGHRLDFLVADTVVLEVKSVETVLPIHEAKLLSDLRSGNWEMGLLINFNVVRLKDGIVRRVLSEARWHPAPRSPRPPE